MITRIIGVDCATDPARVGIACLDWGGSEPLDVALPRRDRIPQQVVVELLETEHRTLIALDAPLGWPRGLARALPHHLAGQPIDVPPNLLFRRLTDRFVKERLGKQPLDVGADRIARTAHSAIGLLGGVSAEPIGLAWGRDFEARVAAIEVYPAGTLVAHGLPSDRYKKPEQRSVRARIVAELGSRLLMPDDQQAILDSADALDAAICVLAAVDFLEDRAFPPPEPDVARKEGWIWVADPDRVRMSAEMRPAGDADPLMTPATLRREASLGPEWRCPSSAGSSASSLRCITMITSLRTSTGGIRVRRGRSRS